jgi:hypothetical protein
MHGKHDVGVSGVDHQQHAGLQSKGGRKQLLF